MVSLENNFPDKVVLDSSFLVPLVDPSHKSNQSADRFRLKLNGSVVSAVNLGEVFYSIYDRSRVGPAAIESVLNGYGVETEPFTAGAARNLNELRRIDHLRYEEQAYQNIPLKDIKTLSLGDMACLSLAIELKLPVLTGDLHWFTLVKHGLQVKLFNYRDKSIIL